MNVRSLLCVSIVLVLLGCTSGDNPSDGRQMKEVRIVNGKYDADPGVKLLEERPPDTLKGYVEKFGREPDELLFVKGEDRFYGYVNGELRVLDTFRQKSDPLR